MRKNSCVHEYFPWLWKQDMCCWQGVKMVMDESRNTFITRAYLKTKQNAHEAGGTIAQQHCRPPDASVPTRRPSDGVAALSLSKIWHLFFPEQAVLFFSLPVVPLSRRRGPSKQNKNRAPPKKEHPFGMATAYRKTQMGRMSRSEVVIGQVSPSFVPPFPPQAEPADAEHHNALTLVQHDRKLIPPSNPSYSSR
ncbi:hypothetical protein VTJ04DRAFT_6480 [Mycothermus thermophilus]|uniref:uncharacterized protein n=1 Tax=Humicola insolens TaxID=85995 RepID=UPI0037431902